MQNSVMGLDAHVYKNFERLPPEVRDLAELVEPNSGEIALKDDKTEGNGAPFNFRAVEIRLGDISLVADLREEIHGRFPDKYPILLGRVLYSGSHSGDWIPREELPALEREIEQIDCVSSAAKEYLREFIQSMKTLIAAAKAESTTIGF